MHFLNSNFRIKLTLFCILIFLLNTPISSQVNPDVAFYPIHVGDTWQYLVEYKYRDAEKDSSYYASVTVRGIDSLYGKVYFAITNSENYSLKHIRIDSTDATVWELNGADECMIDSLSMGIGESFDSECYSIICVNDTVYSMFDEERRVKVFEPTALLTGGLGQVELYKYGYGIGLIYSETTDISIEASRVNRTLVYAKIDGKEYGELPQNHLNYYPLDVGNYWEYNVYYGSDPIHTEYKGSYWIKVIGDTILANNKNYKILETGYFDNSETDFSFERVDSATSSVYRSNGIAEYKIDSLACSVEDTIKCSRFGYTLNLETYCTRIEERNIFNREIKVKYLNDNSGIPNTEYELAENIGLIANYTWEGNSHEEYLQYANVKNIEYGTPVDVKEINNNPTKFNLFQNYPNPFNPSTTIKYSIPVVNENFRSPQNVTLKVFDILGREVATLVNKEHKPGNYEVQFDASSLTSGIYFYQITAVASYSSAIFVDTKKLILLK